MSMRTEAPDSLDFFPTPPWAVRAFLPILQELDPELSNASVWEPACGEGHMASVLAEAAHVVYPTDVFNYEAGWGASNCSAWFNVDFLSENASPDAFATIDQLGIDWIITNPPFKTALQFVELSLARARRGVAMLVRTAWLEGGDRFDRLFSPHPPYLIAQYAERVPMTKGRWDPEASTATSYCWVVWLVGRNEPTEFCWIPPRQRRTLTRQSDIDQFAIRVEAPLLASENQ
jgi:hypothetical protein